MAGSIVIENEKEFAFNLYNNDAAQAVSAV